MQPCGREACVFLPTPRAQPSGDSFFWYGHPWRKGHRPEFQTNSIQSNPQFTGTLARACLPSLSEVHLISPKSTSGERCGRNQVLMLNGRKGRCSNGAVVRQQGIVRHNRTLWPSTASLSIASRLDHVLPLDHDSSGRESKVDDLRNSPLYNPIHAQVKASPSWSLKVICERRSIRFG